MFATFDRYRTPAGTYDEMFDGEAVRGPYARIHNRVTALSPEELRALPLEPGQTKTPLETLFLRTVQEVQP